MHSSTPSIPTVSNLTDGFKNLFVRKSSTRSRSYSDAAESPRDIVKISRTHFQACKDINDFLARITQASFNLIEHAGTSLSCHSINNYGINLKKEPECDDKGRPIRCIIPLYPDDPKEQMQTETISIATPAAFYDKPNKQIFCHESFSDNADVVSASVINEFSCIIIADGCGNRKSAQRAATIAVQTSEKFLQQHLKKSIKNTQEVAKLLFASLDAAQKALVEVNQSIEINLRQTSVQHDRDELNKTRVSGTTFSIAVIAGDKLVVLSVGDCKFYLIRRVDNETACVDVTKHSRRICKNATDPGGRLDGEDEMDLRNLSVAVVPLLDGDIVVGCSDGVHDNFSCAEDFVKVAGGSAPHIIPNVMFHIEKICHAAKRFLLVDANSRLPEDTKCKPDHATIAVAKFEHKQLKKSSGSHIAHSGGK